MPQAGWNLYVGEQKSAVLASVDRFLTRQLVIAVATLALFLLAAGLVYAKVATPIRRLTAAVRSTTVLETPTAVAVSARRR